MVKRTWVTIAASVVTTLASLTLLTPNTAEARQGFGCEYIQSYPGSSWTWGCTANGAGCWLGAWQGGVCSSSDTGSNCCTTSFDQ